jgi:hypothetical protein
MQTYYYDDTKSHCPRILVVLCLNFEVFSAESLWARLKKRSKNGLNAISKAFQLRMTFVHCK